MFSIIGIAKHKERARLWRVLQHHLRELAVLNADASQAHKNVRSGTPGDAAAVTAAVFARVEPLVKRKDAVRAIEVNLAASPDFLSGMAAPAHLNNCGMLPRLFCATRLDVKT